MQFFYLHLIIFFSYFLFDVFHEGNSAFSPMGHFMVTSPSRREVDGNKEDSGVDLFLRLLAESDNDDENENQNENENENEKDLSSLFVLDNSFMFCTSL